MLEIAIISLLPEMFHALDYGVIGRALKKQQLILHHINPRDYAKDAHKTVDSRPYGGGPGMVLQVAPLRAAITAAKLKLGQDTTVIYLSPQGQAIQQTTIAHQLQQHKKYILLCGRYEGIDQRIIQHDIDAEWSIGDFVVSGGELPAMLIIDAMCRLEDGVLGHSDSNKDESFSNGYLEYPQYTRPAEIDGQKVPEVLLSGNHKEIQRYKLEKSLTNTWQKRPDLLKSLSLSAQQRQWLKTAASTADAANIYKIEE